MTLTRLLKSLSLASFGLPALLPQSILAQNISNNLKYEQFKPQNLNSDIARCSCHIDYRECVGCDPNNIPTFTGYTGLSVGALVSNQENESFPFYLGNGFYSGVRFRKYIATDIEVGLLGVETVLSGENYSFGGIFLNPRFILPLGRSLRSLSLYVSPGIRLVSLSGDEVRNTWQVKSGVSFSITAKVHIFGQLRYVKQEDANLRGIELGSSFNF